MPHLHIEYSPSIDEHVDVHHVCLVAYQAMRESGIFPLAGIRVRAFAASHCIVADNHPDNNFMAMTLSIGAGRDTAALKAAGDHLFSAVQQAFAIPLASPYFALSLEIREINADLSWKDTPIHNRLS
ncbi:5-carboxymethyl-2-hydroxymuconate Delta-isomerase [Vreelandella neptunia]|uniref:5-carboxymethyl-2-hydroxymuconate Delta-isomerase n=1 Tax=Vreelandella neptunia TaxID=115551 RepID=A0ABS9SC74_9GAMM|nr:5-carboxymethyl-2-hydroxymuconate Delta-isomerase [Halomonas neptunia]MCH4813713.1 5-carboxymethyl-2-hydroxymuconate Delta-isomerase [Halomonas neptunia]